MRQYSPITTIFSVIGIGIILSVIVLFLLFIYPNPDGMIFDTIRIIIIVLIGYLFYHLYSATAKNKKEGRKEPKHSSEEIKAFNTPLMNSEEESKFEDSIQPILELLRATHPELTPCVYLRDRSGSKLVRRCTIRDGDEFRTSVPLDNETIEDLMVSNELRFVTPNDGEEVFSILFENHENLAPSTAVSVFPILVDNHSAGLLLIRANQFSDFTESYRNSVIAISELIGMQLNQFKRLSDLRSDIHFYSHFQAFEDGLDIERSQDELLGSVVKFCESNFAFDKLTISLLDEIDPHEAVVWAVSGFTMDIDHKNRYIVADSIHGSVITRGESLKIENLAEFQDGNKGRFSINDMEEYQFLSFLGCPIKSGSDAIGALVLESFASRKYVDSDLKMLQIICQRLATLLDWWRNYGKIRETATMDGLTGLLNHRFFLERFDEEINRASRYQENLVLLMMDLDKFKRINDSFGHLYGDYVLAETTRRLKQSVRNIDIVARYGGEEFAIILLKATKENTLHSCKRIVESVANSDYYKDGITVRMTISAGAAEFPVDGKTPRQLIAKADEAMYKVKRRGGNDVEVTEETRDGS